MDAAAVSQSDSDVEEHSTTASSTHTTPRVDGAADSGAKKTKKKSKKSKKPSSLSSQNNRTRKNSSNNGEDNKAEKKQNVFDPLAGLTDEQKERLDAFKERLGLNGENDFKKRELVWLDNMCLLRFLRAREWDLDASEFMIRNTLKWRREFKPHKITAQEIEPEARQGKMYLHVSYDKAQRPLVYMKPGLDTGVDRTLKVKYLVWILELAIANMDVSQGVEKMSWIADFTGTGMRQSGVGNIALSKECLHVVCDHYPERLGKAFLINTPWVFGAFWKCINGLIPAVTLEKIRVHGADYHEDLFDTVDKSAMEAEYGGTSEFKYDHATWCKQNNVEPPAEEVAKVKKSKSKD